MGNMLSRALQFLREEADSCYNKAELQRLYSMLDCVFQHEEGWKETII